MANDNWRTPRSIKNKLDREFNFLADMACTEQNKLCDIGFTIDHDSLNFCWASKIQHTGRGYVWVNPPYSNPMPWVKKAIESQKNGLGVVMLLNCDTSVGWFAEALEFVSEIRFIIADQKENGGYNSGRIAFIGSEGEEVKGNNKPQVILVFNPFKIGSRDVSFVRKCDLLN